MALQTQKILILAGAFFAVAALPSSAFAQQTCDPFQDVPVNVVPVFDEARYDFTVNIAGIQKIPHDPNHTIREGLILGLTHYQPTMEFSTPMRTITLPDGTSCARVVSADVTFGYRDVVIYIASEIPQGTCGFNEVMGHEQKHIAVNQQVLQEYTPIVQQKLAEFLKNNGMFREENRDYAISLLKDKMHEILNDLGGQMFAENQKRQEGVDTREEYSRLGASCDGQLTGTAMQARGAGR